MANTIDSNRIRKTYPFIRRRPRLVMQGETVFDIETASIPFNNETSKTYAFTKTYISVPTCIITPKGENINAYISQVTTSNITVKTSTK